MTRRIVFLARPRHPDDPSNGRSSFGFEQGKPPPASRVRNAGCGESPAGGGGGYIGAVSVRRQDFESDLDVWLNDL